MSDIIFSTSDVVFPTSYVVFVMFEKELPVWVLRHLQGRMPYALCAIAQNARQTAAFTCKPSQFRAYAIHPYGDTNH